MLWTGPIFGGSGFLILWQDHGHWEAFKKHWQGIGGYWHPRRAELEYSHKRVQILSKDPEYLLRPVTLEDEK